MYFKLYILFNRKSIFPTTDKSEKRFFFHLFANTAVTYFIIILIHYNIYVFVSIYIYINMRPFIKSSLFSYDDCLVSMINMERKRSTFCVGCYRRIVFFLSHNIFIIIIERRWTMRKYKRYNKLPHLIMSIYLTYI